MSQVSSSCHNESSCLLMIRKLKCLINKYLHTVSDEYIYNLSMKVVVTEHLLDFLFLQMPQNIELKRARDRRYRERKRNDPEYRARRSEAVKRSHKRKLEIETRTTI